MAEATTRIIVIRPDGESSIYPGTLNLEVTAENAMRAIKSSLQLDGEYELFIKVNPQLKLNSLGESVDAMIVMSRDIESPTNYHRNSLK